MSRVSGRSLLICFVVTIKFSRVRSVQSRDDADSPFAGVCEYELVCERSADSVQPYPPCAHTSWGLGDSVGKYSANLLHGDEAILEASEDGAVEIRMDSSPGIRFVARLKSINYSDDKLSSYVLHRVVGSVTVFLVKVHNVCITLPPEEIQSIVISLFSNKIR